MNYVPLHTHNHFSFLDGMGTPEQWAECAVQLGFSALGISNHNNMVGYIKHWKACEFYGIKPLIGVEITVTRDITDKSRESLETNRDLIVYPRTIKQMRRLFEVMSKANLEGFYYKPRVDWGMLKSLKGMIITTACRRGVVNLALLKDNPRTAKKEYEKLCDCIGSETVYLEVQPQDDIDQQTLNARIELFAKEVGAKKKIIVGTDSHYPSSDDFTAHNILLLVQTRKTIEDLKENPDKVMHFPRGYHLLSPGEVYRGLTIGLDSRVAVQAMQNTVEVSEQINLSIELGRLRMPHYSENPDEDFMRLIKRAWKKFKMKFGRYDKDKHYINGEIYKERLKRELSVIRRMGLQDFFLTMNDVVEYCLKSDIRIRARGSVAGSLAAMLLKITDVDPIKFGLMFERFLNESRTQLHDIPDIDMDLQDDRREEAKIYLGEKWGENHVVNVCTFGTMGSRSAIKDVSRACCIDFKEVNGVTKIMDNKSDIKTALKLYPELRHFEKRHPKVMAVARKLEGQVRHISGHAAGVVVTPKKHTRYFHVVYTKNSVLSCLDMDDLKDMGLLKLDLLGSKVLHICSETEKLIDNKKIRLNKVGFSNSSVYKEFGRGNTIGVFQFGRWHFSKLLKRVKPRNINDLAIVNALGRPGAKQTGQDDIYIRGRSRRKYNGKIDIPQLKTILKDTYGALIFQESVMSICHEIGGLTLGETNEIRESIKHFKHEEMRKWEKRFKFHAIKKLKLPKKEVGKLWNDVKMHSSYSYNKSHSCCYSMLSYYTMYLKVLFSYEFMTSLLNSSHNQEELEMFVEDCMRMKLRMTPPHILKSGKKFTLRTNKSGNKYIVQGLVSIHGIGDKTAEKIMDGRDGGDKKEFVAGLTPGLKKKLLEGGCLGIE